MIFLLHISPLLESSGSVYHLNIGGGIPVGLQTRVTCSPTVLGTTLTGSINDGGAEIDINKTFITHDHDERVQHLFLHFVKVNKNI